MWIRWLHRFVLVELLVSPLLGVANGLVPITVAGVSLPQLTRGMLLVPMLLCLFAVRIPDLRRLRAFLPLLLLLLHAVFLMPVVADGVGYFVQWVRLLYPVTVGLAAYTLCAYGRLSSVFLQRIALYWLLTFCVLLYIGYRAGNIAYESDYTAAPIGLSSSAATILAFLIPFFFLSERWYRRDIIATGLAFMAAAVTQRRSAMLGILVAVTCGCFARAIKRGSDAKSAMIAFVLPAGIVLGLMGAMQHTDWGADFSRRMDNLTFDDDRGGSGRVGLWRYAYLHATERGAIDNLIGEGFDTLMRAGAAAGRSATDAHNEMITVFIDFGLVGFVFYCWFNLALLRIVVHTRKAARSNFEVAVAMLTATFIVGSTAGGAFLTPGGTPTFVLIGYLLANQGVPRGYTLVQAKRRNRANCSSKPHRQRVPHPTPVANVRSRRQSRLNAE